MSKNIFISGACSGMGYGTAIQFAKHGVNVIAADIMENNYPKLEKEIKDLGAKSYFIKMDVSSKDDHNKVVEFIKNNNLILNYAFNNAGIVQNPPTVLHEIDDSIFDKLVNVNLRSVFLGMKWQLAMMKQQGHGSIVNTSSLSGIMANVGFEGVSMYGMSKAGVISLTKSAAYEYSKYNINVNSVCPGAIFTEMTNKMLEINPNYVEQLKSVVPQKRLGTIEEVAYTVWSLCQEGSKFINGQNIIIDGGFTS